ncbi:MAG: hypothetical protein IAF02_28930, partial [Anaerolineae bacterium]|nr:hypothetical protein [Anaerolineae bacterium]
MSRRRYNFRSRRSPVARLRRRHLRPRPVISPGVWGRRRPSRPIWRPRSRFYWHRRYGYLPGYDGWPIVDDLPTIERPLRVNFSAPAKAALRRRHLLIGIWADRLARGGGQQRHFVNRFYGVPGFDWVVRDYFSGPYLRNSAHLAMRLAHQLADRDPDFARRLSFERTLAFAPDGYSIPATDLVHGGMRYQLKPWARLHATAIRQQFRRNHALYTSPKRVRWVFDRQRLALPRSEIIAQIRHTIGQNAHSPYRVAFERLI